jgi:hypothetical protein
MEILVAIVIVFVIGYIAYPEDRPRITRKRGRRVVIEL